MVLTHTILDTSRQATACYRLVVSVLHLVLRQWISRYSSVILYILMTVLTVKHQTDVSANSDVVIQEILALYRNHRQSVALVCLNIVVPQKSRAANLVVVNTSVYRVIEQLSQIISNRIQIETYGDVASLRKVSRIILRLLLLSERRHRHRCC